MLYSIHNFENKKAFFSSVCNITYVKIDIMSYREMQEKLKQSAGTSMTPSEIMLEATEELGEVAQEVALLEQIGTKTHWKKEPSRERLTEEIHHAINCLIGLANYYDVEL